MTLLVVPLVATPSQTLSVQLGGQAVRLNVRQRRTGLFVDVLLDDAVVIAGVIARNMTRIVRGAYLGFTGDLWFYDTQGTDDPAYDGLGARFALLYDPAA